MLLKARGFHVVDLGVNVSTQDFIDAVRKYQPEVLAMSALTTSTSLEMENVIKALKEKGLRNKIKVMVGGGALTRKYSEKIGADSYEHNTQKVLEKAWQLAKK